MAEFASFDGTRIAYLDAGVIWTDAPILVLRDLEAGDVVLSNHVGVARGHIHAPRPS